MTERKATIGSDEDTEPGFLPDRDEHGPMMLRIFGLDGRAWFYVRVTHADVQARIPLATATTVAVAAAVASSREQKP